MRAPGCFLLSATRGIPIAVPRGDGDEKPAARRLASLPVPLGPALPNEINVYAVAVHPSLRPARVARFALGPLIAVAALVIGLVGAPAARGAASNSRGPLLWTAPGGVDPRPLDSIACPSTSLCLAVDRGGYVLWSTNPARGPAAWHSADIDGSHEITSISCPSTAMCVAVDAAGDVIASQDPTGGGSAWTVADVDTSKTQNNTDNAGSILLRGVSCPSTTLCVAVDAAGNELVSTDPAGGALTWTTTHVDANVSYGCTGTGLTCQPPLVGVSCPSTGLCAAVDFSGNLLTTTSPSAAQPWTSTPTDGGGLRSLWGISCPVTGFCATVDGTARHAITLNPANPGAQTSRLLPDSLYGVWCQSRSLCLASAETPGGISGLLGSFDPASPTSTWSLSSLGGVDGVACPTAALCLAADDEGNIADGATTKAIDVDLKTGLLRTRHLPTIATLDTIRLARFVFTSPIPALVTLTWSVPGAAGTPVILGSASHHFYVSGTAKLTLPLSPAGQRLFKSAPNRVTLTATATFAASTGSVSLTKRLTITR